MNNFLQKIPLLAMVSAAMEQPFVVENFRKHFPILAKRLKTGKPLIYMDNAATTQKPQSVIDSIVDFYTNYNSNVHRGMYELSETATARYEEARRSIADFFGVKNSSEIVLVHGATEAINLVAFSYGRHFLSAEDEILIGAAEHHANYLPWQVLESEIGIRRKIIPLDGEYNIDLERYGNSFSGRTKLVAIQHVSNVLGTANDVKLMSKIAHENGARILIDGACSLGSGGIDLYDVDCDFFACSGHKGFGPTGSGFLFGKYEILRAMPPFHTGGSMVNRVEFEGTDFKLPPAKFEAGTPGISAAIGLGEAVTFLKEINWSSAREHLSSLTRYAYNKLRAIKGIKVYANSNGKNGVMSFNLDGVHCHDVATYLGSEGVAVRAGTHCVQPLMDALGVPGTVRISMSLYSTEDEVDVAIRAIENCGKIFGCHSG
jgi:cysteine desulfurase/selenocysteine lyase